MTNEEKRRIAEALLLAASEPLSAARLAGPIPDCTPSQARAFVEELNAEYAQQERAFEICEVAGGYQLRTLVEFAPYLQKLQPVRPVRLSQASLETLAVVAYRQPVTRAEVEHVRGVDVGAVLRGLLERDLVRIAGHREVAGRPLLYATTKRFLEVFGLAGLEDLPTLRDLEELAPSADPAPEDADGSSPDAGDDGDRLAAALPSAEAAALLEEATPVGKPH